MAELKTQPTKASVMDKLVDELAKGRAMEKILRGWIASGLGA